MQTLKELLLLTGRQLGGGGEEGGGRQWMLGSSFSMAVSSGCWPWPSRDLAFCALAKGMNYSRHLQ